MSVIVKQPQVSQQRAPRRIWRVPTSRARWFWLVGSIVVYAGIYAWFLYAAKLAGADGPDPNNDPFRLFGIIAYVMVLGTTAYTLRRRFVRGLPGKVQNWLWMHTWVGIMTILIAMLHENYEYVNRDFNTIAAGLTDPGTYWSGGALFGLIFLVMSGIVGRLLDIWQTRVIAQEASSNGVGIMQSLEERILELEYTIERLCAGKSEAFKDYCLWAIEKGSTEQELQKKVPSIASNERPDFQRTYETLATRSQLVSSLHRQKRAHRIIRVWRTTHIVLACLAVLVISYHGVMELLSNVFHLITPPA